MLLDICGKEFSFHHRTIKIKFSLKEEYVLIKEMKENLEKQVRKESIHEEGKFISPLFLSQILNLKKPNECLTCFLRRRLIQ